MEKLRFKGNFVKSLKNMQVSELGKIQSGGTPSTKKREFWNGDINWIQSGLIQNNIIKKEDISKKITRLGLEKSASKIIESNSILVAITGATCANVALLPFEATANQSVISITPKKDNVYYLFQYLLYKRNEILRLQGGSAQGGVTLNDLKQMNIRIPEIEEQEKIGGFLSIFDKLIEKQQDKIGLLMELKKGYLQKMFPKSDTNVPEIRFKGFTDAWELFKLGDIGTFKSNGVDKLSKPNEVPVNLLNYVDVYNRREISNKNASELMQVTAKQSQLIDNNILKNDVFFTPTSETPDDIGRVYVIEETLNNTVYSYHLMRYRPKDGVFYPNFPNYSLTTSHVRQQFFISAKGVQRFVISKADFEAIENYIPKYEEQAKIGEMFRSIDSLIILHQRKLDQLEKLKKGYMQRLFA